jgi:hypothetical protein
MDKAKDKDKERTERVRARTCDLSLVTLIPSENQTARIDDASLAVVEFHILRSLTDTQPTVLRRERLLTDIVLASDSAARGPY